MGLAFTGCADCDGNAVPRNVGMMSVLISAMIEDDNDISTESVVPLPNVKSNILKKVGECVVGFDFERVN